MCALLVCLFVISASATDFVSNKDNYSFTQYTGPSLYYTQNYNGKTCFMIHVSDDSQSDVFFVPAKQFQEFVSSVLTEVSYENWFSFCGENYKDDDNTTVDYFLEYWYNVDSILNEEYFNKLMNYKTVTEEDLSVQYNQGLEDGKELGYAEGYSKGMEAYAQEEKDLIEQYYTHYNQGGDFTANGLDEYISSNSSETFRDIYASVGTSANYWLFEQNFSSGSSSSSSQHGGSTITESSKGDNYGASHVGSVSTDCCYNPGYIDGVADGGANCKKSDSYQADITNEINSYMRSEEYQTLMNEYSAQVVEQYIESNEYKFAIDSSFVAGQEAGEADAWEKAKDEVLAEGVRQGYLNYKGSQEYKDAIDSSKTAGYIDGVEDGKNSVVDPTGVLVLFAIVIFLGIIIFAIHKKARSKRKR